MADKDKAQKKLHDSLDELMEEDLERYEKTPAPDFQIRAESAAADRPRPKKKKRGRSLTVRIFSYAAAACVLVAAGYGAAMIGVYGIPGTEKSSGRNDYSVREYEEAYEIGDEEASPVIYAADSLPALTEFAADTGLAAYTPAADAPYGTPAETDAPAPGNIAAAAAAPVVEEIAVEALEDNDQTAGNEKDADADPGEKGAGSEKEETSEEPARKLVTTYSINAESLDFDADTAALEAGLAALGGYIEASSLRDSSSQYQGGRSVSYTLRVPAHKAEAFVGSLSTGMHITSKTTKTEDITLNYSDMAARLASCRSELSTLEELVQTSDNVSDILEIESVISDLHYRIDSYETSLRIMDNQVNYTTISLNVCEVKQVTETGKESAGERISRGFSDSLENIRAGAVDFFVWFVSNILYLAAFAVLLAVVIVILKKMIRGRKTGKDRRGND